LRRVGGIAPLRELLDLKNRYDLFLFIDDAHGTSIEGTNGCGHVRSKLGEDIGERVILAASLAKGFGASGGMLLLGSRAQEDLVRRYSQSYSFSACPSIPAIGAALASALVHETMKFVNSRNGCKSGSRHLTVRTRPPALATASP
jgi:8-amino-7-oxononanoate synthase